MHVCQTRHWYGQPFSLASTGMGRHLIWEKIKKKGTIINRKVRSIVDLGGAVISQRNILAKLTQLFRHDGTNLSRTGNEL